MADVMGDVLEKGGGNQRAPKEEEMEDSRVEEASLVDIRANWSVDGSEERTVEETAERDFRLRRVVTM